MTEFTVKVPITTKLPITLPILSHSDMLLESEYFSVVGQKPGQRVPFDPKNEQGESGYVLIKSSLFPFPTEITNTARDLANVALTSPTDWAPTPDGLHQQSNCLRIKHSQLGDMEFLKVKLAVPLEQGILTRHQAPSSLIGLTIESSLLTAAVNYKKSIETCFGVSCPSDQMKYNNVNVLVI